MQIFTVCFLLPLILNVHADIVKNFQDRPCNQYFYKGKEPQVQSSTSDVHICQTFENTPYFATLYDTANRIPVYSAYLHEKTPGPCRWEGRWFIEQKLVNQNWEKSMMWEGDLALLHPGVPLGERQALDIDYIGVTDYNRGHLNPNQHHKDPGCRATYTLTNIAPQNIRLNGGPWETYENNVHNALQACKTAYVLVGAIPSPNQWIGQNNQNRVNIPAYFWHAYCCELEDGNFRVGAAAVRNEVMNVQTCSLDSLKKFFGKVKARMHLPFLDNCTARGKTTTDVSNGDCQRIIPEREKETK